MSRALSRSLTAAAIAACLFASPRADGRSATLERFLALDDPNPSQYIATRHLEARSEHLDKSARMDVAVEADARGFRYRIVAEEGSEYIRNRIFRKTLESERAMWSAGAPAHDGLTPDNYLFEDVVVQPDGTHSLRVKPRRKEMMLFDGAIFLNPQDGDLVKIEGKLAKTPSFWTRQVHITRWYKRLAGIRMPVALESVANVRIAGESTFRMTYQYECVNGSKITDQ